jgi:hypothetical protein
MTQQWIDLDTARLWENNYNKGDIKRLKKLFRRFGFNGALRMWNGVIMAGNNSTIALRELAVDKWQPKGAGIRTDDNGRWQVAYLDVSHLSDNEAKAFALSDNHSARVASPDYGLMTGLMRELEDADSSLLGDVFNEDEIAEFAELALLAEGLETELESEPSEGKRVGHERAKQVKVVIAVSDLPIVERAIDSTGEENRGTALIKICEAYLRGKK